MVFCLGSWLIADAWTCKPFFKEIWLDVNLNLKSILRTTSFGVNLMHFWDSKWANVIKVAIEVLEKRSFVVLFNLTPVRCLKNRNPRLSTEFDTFSIHFCQIKFVELNLNKICWRNRELKMYGFCMTSLSDFKLWIEYFVSSHVKSQLACLKIFFI